MSSTGLPTLTIDVAARRAERYIAVSALLIVPIAIALWNLPVAALSVAVPLASIGIAAAFFAVGWLGGPRRIARVVCRDDGRWSLCEASGREMDAELSTATRISSHAVWLRWKAGRDRPLLLISGDIAEPDFRRLLVRLRVKPFRTTDET